VCICFLHIFFSVEEAAEVNITCSLAVHHDDVLTVEDADSDFEVLKWFWLDVPFLGLLLDWDAGVINFNPHFHLTLAHFTWRVLKLSILDWLVVERLPFDTKESVF
jgi:hypothetical protein